MMGLQVGTSFTYLVLTCLMVWIGFAGGQTPQLGLTYCKETSPLDTKYFVPFYESHVPVSGCASKETSATLSGYHIHVIRINSTFKEVMLHFNENDYKAKGLILVLDSVTPIRWRLSFLGVSEPSYKRILYLSTDSSVHSSNAAITSYGNIEQLKTRRNMSDSEYFVEVRNILGGITTFSNIFGANRISISLTNPDTLSTDCLVAQGSSAGNSVLAYLVTKQSMSGCFHPDVAGTSPSDVHVIDLVTADPDAGANARAAADNLPAVYLSLSPDQRGSSVEENISRNLTLILKSQLPVRWFLESWGLSGNLEVISNNGLVENYSLSSGQHLHIVKRHLPEAFDLLWKSVIVDTGSTPVSYVKIELANVLSMVIPPRSKRGLADFFNGDGAPARLVPDATNIVAGESTRGTSANTDLPGEASKDLKNGHRLVDLESILESHLAKRCTDNQIIQVSIPLSVTNAYNITGVRFQEWHCDGVKNATHWVLKTRSTSCGSMSYFSGNNPTVRNNVFFKFAPGTEFAETTVRIPVLCKFPAGLPGFPGSNFDYNDELEQIGDDSDYDNYENKDDEELEQDEVYRLRVYRSSPAPSALLIENPGDPATIVVGDRVKIETDFDTRSPLSLALEQCWLSDGTDLQLSQERKRPDDPRWLIWQGCPSNPNVTISTVTHYPTFAFTVTPEHHKMKKFYIACLIGLCSPGGLLSGGNIRKCPDISACSYPNSGDHVGPAAQQLSKRGPIFILDNREMLETSDHSIPTQPSVTLGIADNWRMKQPVISNNNNNNNNNSNETPSLHSSHVVMVGVPAEIAVVIALASFIIGAALTGLLCCVHHRRTMPKNNFHLQVGPNDPVEGSELQSMIASPSLQPHQPNGTITT